MREAMLCSTLLRSTLGPMLCTAGARAWSLEFKDVWLLFAPYAAPRCLDRLSEVGPEAAWWVQVFRIKDANFTGIEPKECTPAVKPTH